MILPLPPRPPTEKPDPAAIKDDSRHRFLNGGIRQAFILPVTVMLTVLLGVVVYSLIVDLHELTQEQANHPQASPIPHAHQVALVTQVPKEVTSLSVNTAPLNTMWCSKSTYSACVEVVGKRLIQANHLNQPITFRVSYDPNELRLAYASTKNRQITLNRTILSLISSDDELASLLGHEMAHIEYNMDSFAHWLLQQRDERTQHFQKELEADILGATMAANAGYNPMGALLLMETLLKLQTDEQKSVTHLLPQHTFQSSPTTPKTPQSGLHPHQPDFETHPPTTQRLRVLTYLMHTRYAQWIRKAIPVESTLEATLMGYAQESQDLQEKLKNLSQRCERLKATLKKTPYTRSEDLNRDRNRYSRCAHTFNYALKEGETIQMSLLNTLQKYQGETAPGQFQPTKALPKH